jgi:hypothetical protein
MAESGSRVFVQQETALSLIERAYNFTDAQAERFSEQYREQWLHVTGSVVNVSVNTGADSLVTLKLGDLIYQAASLYITGDRQTLEALNKGDRVTALGRVFFVSSRGISLAQCEIVSVVDADIVRAAEGDLRDYVPETDSGTPRALLTAEATSESKPRLPNAALELWHKAFLKAYPSGTVTLAIKSAMGAFPDHHVARKRIRELFPNAPRGRPKKNNDLANSPESDSE